jgi:hypothetical protein
LPAPLGGKIPRLFPLDPYAVETKRDGPDEPQLSIPRKRLSALKARVGALQDRFTYSVAVHEYNDPCPASVI